MDYTLAQVQGYAGAIADLERERLLLAATAARAGGQNDTAWEQWTRALSGAGAGR